MKSLHLSAVAAAVLLLLASCARPAYEQRGYASYIADQYAGRYTSSGEVYNPQGWTAAHNTLPFGTQVKVKSNHNGRAVNLTVNDRFPNYPGRVINISRAAAEYLQIPPYQLADVTVTAQTIPGGGYGAAPAPAQGYGAAAPVYNQGMAQPPTQTFGPPPTVYPNTPPPPVGAMPPAH